MTKPNCRFCNAKPSLQSIKGEFVYGGTPEQHFWKCDACQIIYLFPPLSEDEELSFYKKNLRNTCSKNVNLEATGDPQSAACNISIGQFFGGGERKRTKFRWQMQR
jgi:hypothetical protein